MVFSEVDLTKLLDETLGEGDLPALTGCVERSNGIIGGARDAIQAVYLAQPEEIRNSLPALTWVAVGSVGRSEATDGSDLDLILVHEDLGDDHIREAVRSLDQEVRAHIRTDVPLVAGVSKGQELTAPTSLRDLANDETVGGSGDSVAHHTRRILLLTESRLIFSTGRDLRAAAQDAIFSVYQASPVTRGRHFLNLINDIVRYYRTLGIDYKFRVDFEDKPWAVRNLKLRHARKTWFFGTALGIVAITSDCKYRDEEEEQLVKNVLDLPPSLRLVFALHRAGMQSHLSVLRLFDRFLGELGRVGVREDLSSVDHAGRYDNENYRTLKDNSDHLHERYLHIIDDLPGNWKRNLLSHFLL